MKYNQKPCIKTKKVINRGKRSKTLSVVKQVQNIIESSKFALQRARMSVEFDSRKIHIQKNLNKGQLSFRELCHSKLSGLHSFDNNGHNPETEGGL